MADDSRQTHDDRGHAISDAHAFSRRNFLKGVAGAAAGAGVIAAVESTTGCGKKTTVSSTGLMVSSSNLITIDNLTEVAAEDYISTDLNVTLPTGTMMWSASDTYAILLLPGSTARPLNTIAVLDMASAEYSTVLDQAVGADDGFEIYEVRASGFQLLWTEVNYTTSDWRVYCATLNGLGNLGRAALFDQGDANYNPPLLCVSAKQAVWTLVPTETGSKSKEGSLVKTRSTSDNESNVIYSAKGFDYAIPERSDSIVTNILRADTDSTNYALVAQDPASGDIISQVVMPKAVRPMGAIYMKDHFAFQIEASFDSTSAIAQMGTYYDLGNGRYFRLNKAPACTPAYCGNWFVTKSGKSTLCIDFDKQCYFVISAPQHSTSYGDYLATSGTCKKFLLYSTVTDASDATKSSVQARGYSLL